MRTEGRQNHVNEGPRHSALGPSSKTQPRGPRRSPHSLAPQGPGGRPVGLPSTSLTTGRAASGGQRAVVFPADSASFVSSGEAPYGRRPRILGPKGYFLWGSGSCICR